MVARSEVDERSFLWPERTVPYQQWGTASPTGDRPDCSGYVGGCCWDIPVPVNTVTLVTDGWMYEIEPAALQLGDAIGLCGLGTGGNDGHIMLFRGWTESGLDIAEQNGDGLGPVHRTIKRIPLGYRAYRFKGITEDAPRSPQRKDDEMFMLRDKPGSVAMVDGVDPATRRARAYWIGNAEFEEYKRAGIELRQLDDANWDLYTMNPAPAAAGPGGAAVDYDRIEHIVDEQLDQQSLGGADNDSDA